MKITKYEKKKNGIYQVYFDNGNNVDLYENIILNYNLLIKKEVSVEQLDKMLEENKKYIAYNLAIKYISTKMRAKKEIVEYLKRKEIDNTTIDEVISLLLKEKYLDDYSFAKSFVNDKILLSSDGPSKIRGKLEEFQINDESINDALSSFTYEIQKEKVEKIANKLVTTNKTKSTSFLKNKIFNYLYNLGYERSVIVEVVNKLKFSSDKDIAKKEYEKLYKKLSRKYSGSDLEFRIKQKMYALGFNNYDN